MVFHHIPHQVEQWFVNAKTLYATVKCEEEEAATAAYDSRLYNA